MKVINLFAGPGAGKSTTAAGLFHLMKLEGYKVELVTEYAKELVYEDRKNVLSDQIYVTAKQNRRLQRLEGHVDWVITDSPLLLGKIYAEFYEYKHNEFYLSFIEKLFNTYDNILFHIRRVKPYKEYGRNENAETAIHLDSVIINTIISYVVRDVQGDRYAPEKILNILRDEYDL